MMEEEVNYSTMVFKTGASLTKEKIEDSTIYSEVKSKAPAGPPPAPEKNEDPTIYSEIKTKAPPAATSAAPEAEGKAAACSHFPLLLACSEILCVLLLAGIIAIIYMSLLFKVQSANLSNLTAEYQRLAVEKEISDNKTQELRRERDNLNQTLEVILKFDNFPVNDYCPNKQCQPCRSGWIPFKNKCYLFYNENAPWKTWGASREYCKGKAADLVVVDDLKEQEFLSSHITYYHDDYHGYFIGLQKTANNWVWIDGHNDTLSYWMKDMSDSSVSYVLIIPGKNATKSWVKADNVFENKFICETDALLLST
ncbi:C-type lectin domain family 12 member B-like [Pelmatolapia mariae]|uniref:C-type lectin domain family 12 member B-like n=1 Tax=Pelmatolapia mariae TaxID=158779 RepID=UPI002FE59421